MKALPVELRFERYFPVPESGCWIWDGPTNRKGYGIMATGTRGAKALAHRAFYARFVAPIPDDMCVCHKCDTPPCVNPAHLFVGSKADNMADRKAKGRYIGEWNGQSKLTEAQALEILALNGKARRTELAKRFRVSESAIAMLQTGRTWAHLREGTVSHD